MIEHYFTTEFYPGVGSFAHNKTVGLLGKVSSILNDDLLGKDDSSYSLVRGTIRVDDRTLDFEVDPQVDTIDLKTTVSRELSRKLARSFLNYSLKNDDEVVLVGVYSHSEQKEKCKLHVFRIWLGNETIGISGEHFEKRRVA